MRRKIAKVLALVLLLELAVLLCACAHIACHQCAHGPECPICACVRLGLKPALLPGLALELALLFGKAPQEMRLQVSPSIKANMINF